MIEYFRIDHKIPNSEDGLECLPACLAMSVEALGKDRLTLEEAGAVAGYRAGVETWPYRMIAWLSSNGYEVVHIDAIDPIKFAAEPLNVLREEGFDQETIDYFIKITNFESESQAINEAIGHGAKFVSTLPSSSDLVEYLEKKWIPILTLDAGVLIDEDLDGYQGHMVIVSGYDAADDMVLVQDPGPAARWDLAVPTERVMRALRTPSDSSGTITCVRLASSEGGGN